MRTDRPFGKIQAHMPEALEVSKFLHMGTRSENRALPAVEGPLTHYYYTTLGLACQ